MGVVGSLDLSSVLEEINGMMVDVLRPLEGERISFVLDGVVAGDEPAKHDVRGGDQSRTMGLTRNPLSRVIKIMTRSGDHLLRARSTSSKASSLWSISHDGICGMFFVGKAAKIFVVLEPLLFEHPPTRNRTLSTIRT